MGLFSFLGFGSNKQSTTVSSSTKVDVEVNPQIGVGIDVDTTPIAEALAADDEQDRAAIAALVLAGREQTAAVADSFGGLARTLLLIAAGVGAVVVFGKVR